MKENSNYILKETQPSEDYIIATYYLETSADPWTASIGIAKEQSASSWIVMQTNKGRQLDKFLAKVVSVDEIGYESHEVLTPYQLKTYSYSGTSELLGGKCRSIITRIAYPIRNFESSFTTMLNTVAGEVHRLGYLSAIKLLDLNFPQSYLRRFHGPKFGITGIRTLLNIPKRPLFCRSTQPPMGLKIEDMEKIAFSVLNGGFDIIKDDELTYDTKEARFKKRVSSLAKVARKVEQETGEKKLYFANVIDDFNKVTRLSQLAVESGADGIVVSPLLCSFSVLRSLSEKFEVPIFSHHSLMDVFTRHPAFGIDYSLMVKLQRMCGADFIVTPGPCGTTALSLESTKKIIYSCKGKLGFLKETFPVLAGGKQASKLLEYVERIDSTDFMLLVANAVDNHPMGLESGARAFRQSWCAIENDIPIPEFAHSHRELEEAIISDTQA